MEVRSPVEPNKSYLIFIKLISRRNLMDYNKIISLLVQKL